MQSERSTVQGLQRDCNITIQRSIDSVKETVAIAKTTIPFTPRPELYSMGVQFNEDLHDMVSLCHQGTYRGCDSVSITSTALLTGASLLHTDAAQSLVKKDLSLCS